MTARTTMRVQIVDGTAGYHPHESPWTMLVPLGLLSLGAVFAGFAVPRMPSSSPRAAPSSGTAASRSDEHLAHAVHEVPLWVKLTAVRGDADRPGDRLSQLHPRARRARRRSSRSSAGLHHFLMHKWYFDELYDVALRPPGDVARPPVLEARRRGDDRPLRPARRGLCGRRRQPRHRAAPVGLSLQLRAGHAARPDRRGELGRCGGSRERLSDAHPDDPRAAARRGGLPVPVGAAAARWIALVATLVDLALGIVLWAAYDLGGAQWQFVEQRRRSAAASPGRSASTASR